MEALTIATAAPYEVLFGRGLLAQAGALTSKVVRGRRAVIVSDDIVADLYMDAARAAYESAGFQVVSYVFPHGEHSKSLDVLGALKAARVAVGRVYSEPPTLNDVFLEITGRELRD